MRRLHTLAPEGRARRSGSRVRRPTSTTRLMLNMSVSIARWLTPHVPKLRIAWDGTRERATRGPAAVGERVEPHHCDPLAGVCALDRPRERAADVGRRQIQRACHALAARPRAA